VPRRVVRLSSDTPSSDSITDNRRLTVEIGIPNERAARLMLSNWATLTNIRTSSRFDTGGTFPFLEITFQSFPSYQARCTARQYVAADRVIGTRDQQPQ